MKLSEFKLLIKTLEEQDDMMDAAYKANVDLIHFVDGYHKCIHLLMSAHYGTEGVDWWSWFCYENDFGKKGLTASDKGTPICYDVKSLWQYLEKGCKL